MITKGKDMPPVTLLKTWLWMAKDARDDGLRRLGCRNLMQFFSSLEQAERYIAERGGRQARG